jgi:hypothetical protein
MLRPNAASTVFARAGRHEMQNKKLGSKPSRQESKTLTPIFAGGDDHATTD